MESLPDHHPGPDSRRDGPIALTPEMLAEPALALPARDERVPLARLLLDHRLESLLVLTTGTARADITRMLSDAGVAARPEFLEANFGSSAEFLGALRHLRERRDVAGVALARGGGGGQDEVGGSREVINALIELNMPFYAAFGHATDLVLIDKYADQSFHAPSGLGAEIARAIKESIRWKIQNATIRDQTQLSEDLDKKLKNLESNLLRNTYVHKGGVSVSWKFISILFLIIIFVCSMYRDIP